MYKCSSKTDSAYINIKLFWYHAIRGLHCITNIPSMKKDEQTKRFFFCSIKQQLDMNVFTQYNNM